MAWMNMMEIPFTPGSVVLTIAVLCFLVKILLKRPSSSVAKASLEGLKLPPSLPSLPVVGSIPFIPDYSGFHTFFTKKAQSMGPVIGFYMGKQYVVMVTGREALHDALAKKSDMANRPLFYCRSKYSNPRFRGIGEHMYDEEFRKQHQLTLNILRDFGYGKRVMETRIRKEVDCVLDCIREFQGSEFNIKEVIASGVFNIICSILFNKRYEMNDPDLKKIIELDDKFFTLYYNLMAIDAIPDLLYLSSYQKKLEENLNNLSELMRWTARAMLDAAFRKDEGESFVSSYIERQCKQGYDYEDLHFIVRDLILGGTDTSAVSVEWFIIYMANYPDIQRNVQDEIDKVVERDRAITLDDEKALPYTHATLLELSRLQMVAALGLPHSASKDTNVLDYFIPAGTMIISNLYSVHMDPETWPDPHEFKPQRFLDSSGSVVNKEKLVSFSLGKRSCIGEQLAKQEVFLFCASLAQHFQILPPVGYDRITVSEKVFLTTSPTDFKARLIPRNIK